MFNHLNQAKDGDKNNHHKEINTKAIPSNHLGAPDGAVDGDLLIPPDSKATDGVTRL